MQSVPRSCKRVHLTVLAIFAESIHLPAFAPDHASGRGGLDLRQWREVLIEESLVAGKEFERESCATGWTNCVVVCSMKNFDPMGRAYRRLHHRRAGANVTDKDTK